MTCPEIHAKIQKAVYESQEVEFTGKEIAILFSEILERYEEIKQQIKNLNNRESRGHE